MPVRSGNAVLGGTLAGLGGVLLTLGVTRSSVIEAPVLGVPGATLASAGGLALVVSGAMLVAFSSRRDDAPAPAISAEEAFMRKPSAPLPVEPPPPRAPVAKSAAPSSLGIPVPTRPTPPATPAAPAAPVTPQEARLREIEDEVRELTRKINKAGVMLATGQLSNQGYVQYVADLKRQRGKLEANLVKAELQRRT